MWPLRPTPGGCSAIVSVTQSFNTTTSMGRLTLNVLLSFAQFEREVTGERIRDKIAASKKKGMWMGVRGGPDAACSAGSCFGKALSIARRQKTKALELRSALSLAQLRVRQNRSKEALDLLKPVYHWFKEGFDNPDLLRAGDLLKSLRD